MKQILPTIALMTLSLPSFADYDVKCWNWRGDGITARIRPTGETRTSGQGRWVHKSVLVDIEFDVRGHRGSINKKSEVMIENDEWYVDATNRFQGGYEFVSITKRSDNKIIARYTDTTRGEAKLLCVRE